MRSTGSTIVVAAILVGCVLFFAMGEMEDREHTRLEIGHASGHQPDERPNGPQLADASAARVALTPSESAATPTAYAADDDVAVPTEGGMGERYPLLADLEVLDDTTLAELDLGTLDERGFVTVLRHVRAAAKEREQALIDGIPREARDLVDTAEARERRAGGPEVYLVAMPSTGNASFGDQRFLDLSPYLTPELAQLRELNAEIHGHPRFDAMKIDRALASLPEGHAPIAEWIEADWGALRIGVDANGNEVVRLGERYLGMP